MRSNWSAQLCHDVGKYLARTARNLPAGNIPPEVARMLMRDLYALGPGQRASQLFAGLRADAPESAGPALADIEQLLAEIDRLEPQVRAQDCAAMRRGANLALEIERRLRALAIQER